METAQAGAVEGRHDMSVKRIIRTYTKRRDADKAITSAQAKGWNVDSFQVVNKQEGWAFWKTCCLGCLFLPLALLGKKPDTTEYIVGFSREDGASEIVCPYCKHPLNAHGEHCRACGCLYSYAAIVGGQVPLRAS